MEDLSAKLAEILKDPKAMQQISAIGNMLSQQGSRDNSNEKSSGSNAGGNIPNADTISALLASLGTGQNNPTSNASELPAANPEMASTLMQLAPLLSSIKQDDQSTRLLHALRPFLGNERKKKLDESAKMLQLMKLLPLLKDTGILQSIF